MSSIAIVHKTAYALKNLDQHEKKNQELQNWIKFQYDDLQPKEGVSKEEALASLKKAEASCANALKTIQEGRKELENILNQHGFNGRAVIALATVSKDFI